MYKCYGLNYGTAWCGWLPMTFQKPQNRGAHHHSGRWVWDDTVSFGLFVSEWSEADVANLQGLFRKAWCIMRIAICVSNLLSPSWHSPANSSGACRSQNRSQSSRESRGSLRSTVKGLVVVEGDLCDNRLIIHSNFCSILIEKPWETINWWIFQLINP